MKSQININNPFLGLEDSKVELTERNEAEDMKNIQKLVKFKDKLDQRINNSNILIGNSDSSHMLSQHSKKAPSKTNSPTQHVHSNKQSSHNRSMRQIEVEFQDVTDPPSQ